MGRKREKSSGENVGKLQKNKKSEEDDGVEQVPPTGEEKCSRARRQGDELKLLLSRLLFIYNIFFKQKCFAIVEADARKINTGW